MQLSARRAEGREGGATGPARKLAVRRARVCVVCTLLACLRVVCVCAGRAGVLACWRACLRAFVVACACARACARARASCARARRARGCIACAACACVHARARARPARQKDPGGAAQRERSEVPKSICWPSAGRPRTRSPAEPECQSSLPPSPNRKRRDEATSGRGFAAHDAASAASRVTGSAPAARGVEPNIHAPAWATCPGSMPAATATRRGRPVLRRGPRRGDRVPPPGAGSCPRQPVPVLVAVALARPSVPSKILARCALRPAPVLAILADGPQLLSRGIRQSCSAVCSVVFLIHGLPAGLARFRGVGQRRRPSRSCPRRPSGARRVGRCRRPPGRWAPASEAAPRPAPAPPPPAPDPKPGFWVLAGGGARLARGILVKKPAQHRRPAGRVVARTDRGGVRSWASLTPPRSVPATTRPAAGPGSPERSRTLVLRGRLRTRDPGTSACGF